jgi:hypothetical protein
VKPFPVSAVDRSECKGMSGKTDEVARILRRLQAFVRRPPSGGRTVRTARVPDDIATADCKWLCLEPDEEQAYGQAQALLLGDLRFEYLEQREAADAVWRFVCQCHLDRAHDHVVSFIAEHAREILELTCYLPVEYLEVEAETDIAGLRVLPTTADEIPRQGRRFVLDPPVRCVVAVPVSGTSYKRMAERARAVAEHGLRVLRIALRESRGVHDDQLRFRLGEAYAFGDRLSGWDRHPGSPYPLRLTDADVEMVRSQSVAGLPFAPGNKLERQASLAVRWMERAALATDLLVRLLYLFFALESLLVQGWINYYGRFYQSQLYPLLRRINEYLVRWACRKFKRLRRREKRARELLAATARRSPALFAHWRFGIKPDGWTMGAV